MTKPISFMGLALKNPLIVAAGPWSGGAAAIQKCIDAGAAAVITETIVMGEPWLFSPRIYYHDDELLNLSLYGKRTLEEWEGEVERVRKDSCHLICSIRASSPSEIAYIAQRTERLGADALQLDLYAPMDSMIEDIHLQPEKLYEFVHAAASAVSIPVMTRLPYNLAASAPHLHAVERAGLRAICAIESLRALSGVDLETQTTLMPTYGGYTGRHIRPISLAATATLAQLTDLPICGVGGVEDYRSILEFIMLGAAAAQLGSAIMLHGYDLITKTVRALEDWMQAHGYDDYSSITGAALSSLTPFEKAVHRRAVCRMTQPCSRTGCGLCTCGCMYGALVMEPDGVHLNSSQCTGCGLCAQRCPQGLFHLETF